MDNYGYYWLICIGGTISYGCGRSTLNDDKHDLVDIEDVTTIFI